MSTDKLRVSIVNYSNTLPFKWALKRGPLIQKIDLQEDIPSICAQKLKFGQVDLALVPVALLSELESYQIQSSFCIGAKGKVDSVKLYAECPVSDLKEVCLDYQSKTSNALLRILMRHHWKKTVHYTDALPGFEQNVGEGRGIVVIGDRTFSLNGTFRYEYDLSEEWYKFCAKPFVFAAWVSTQPLPTPIINEFNTCLQFGLSHIDEAVEAELGIDHPLFNYIKKYLHERIDYVLDQEKISALKYFLSLQDQKNSKVI